jgi:hypothetical protein
MNTDDTNKPKSRAATPNAFNRKAQSAGTLATGLGPLQALVTGNQWVGDTGFNLMVVPNPQSQFIVMVTPTFETHIFEEVPAPVPNRTMLNGTQQVGAVKYSQIVAEGVTKNILHEETGMWLNQTVGFTAQVPDAAEYGLVPINGTLPGGQDAVGLATTNPIVRSGTIPHGNTIQATGAATIFPALPLLPPFTPPVSGNVLPYIALENFQNDGAGNLQFLPYYKDGSPSNDLVSAYITALETALSLLGNKTLTTQQFVDPIGFLDSQANNLLEIVSMAVTTIPGPNGGGAVINIPFETAVVGPQSFTCTFLIETVLNTSPNPDVQPGLDEAGTFSQLQYLQSIPLLFPGGFNGKDVIFPHFNLNTLIAI